MPIHILADGKITKRRIPGWRIIILHHSGHIILLPEDLAPTSHIGDLEQRLALFGCLEVKGPVGRQDQSQHIAGHRNFPIQGDLFTVTVVHDRVIALQGIAVLQHITDPDIGQYQIGRLGTGIEKMFQIGFTLEQPQLLRLKAIQRLTITPDPDPVDRQGFIGRIKIKGELGGPLQSFGAGDLYHIAVETLHLLRVKIVLPIHQQITLTINRGKPGAGGYFHHLTPAGLSGKQHLLCRLERRETQQQKPKKSNAQAEAP